ncbi:Hypothetical predicted protein [Mytilus galloprovincialis]|uniref:Uncharacterized protein n=1 Tax=Mytilus galloprovincialis TaxID=29158 RepID=A0A8B6HMN7_MYTGA|nr:Hypothetical predicted protein [Mytilus galloprovincialis]
MAPIMPLAIVIHVMFFAFAIGIPCPHSSQWKLRGSGFCNNTYPWYNCLYDENRMQYTEFCRNHPKFQRPGYKFIIRGNLDGKQCEDTYYQPIKFWTNGSSNCIFKKSTCNEEGQVAFNNGNGTSNRKCRCDYTAGYAFVTKPNAKCFCDPEQEDCACYLTTCKPFHLLTPGQVS